MAFEASGTGGRVFVGYQRALDIATWSIVKREEVLADPVTILEGKAENIDEFWSRYSKVSVRLRMSGCQWAWALAEMGSVEPLIIMLYGPPSSLPLET